MAYQSKKPTPFMIFSFKFCQNDEKREHIKTSTINIIFHERDLQKKIQNQHNWSSFSVSHFFPFILISFSVILKSSNRLGIDFEKQNFDLLTNLLVNLLILVLLIRKKKSLTLFTYLYCFSWINLPKIYQFLIRRLMTGWPETPKIQQQMYFRKPSINQPRKMSTNYTSNYFHYTIFAFLQ